MFILSKILLFLLFPLTWVFVLLITGLVTKTPKRKQRLFIATLVLLYLFSIPFLLDVYATCWDYPPPVAIGHTPVYSCAIVLGGFSSEKADSSGYFNGAADRFIEALKLHATHQATHLLISGGDGRLNADGFSEAIWVAKQLKQMNVPDSAVLIEGKSKNTIENALYTKRLLVARHLLPPYLLVTSAFHMRRSTLIFEKTGLTVVPYACNYIAGTRKFSLGVLWPESGVLSTWEIYTKEAVGYVVAFLWPIVEQPA